MALLYTQASPLFSLHWQALLEFSVSFTGHLKREERSISRWRPFHSLSSEFEINNGLQGMAGDGEGAYTAASNYLRTPTATSGLVCHVTVPPWSVSLCRISRTERDAEGFGERKQADRYFRQLLDWMYNQTGLNPVTYETYHFQVGVESRVRFLTLLLMLRLSGYRKVLTQIIGFLLSGHVPPWG